MIYATGFALVQPVALLLLDVFADFLSIQQVHEHICISFPLTSLCTLHGSFVELNGTLSCCQFSLSVAVYCDNIFKFSFHCCCLLMMVRPFVILMTMQIYEKKLKLQWLSSNFLHFLCVF